jgi:hypothetical protein
MPVIREDNDLIQLHVYSKNGLSELIGPAVFTVQTAVRDRYDYLRD